MVQVDVFWSYGIGAGFAYAAQKQLQEKPPTKENGGFLANKYFTLNLLYLATMFAPSGLYLLWGFTNWETMQAGDKDMPAWLVTLFAITNVTQGILGFWVTYKLQSAGKRYAAFLQILLGYFCMFFVLVHGWDGRGYQRFFSQDRADFLAWTPATIGRWFLSPVAFTLGAMGLVLIPVMVGWMGSWMVEAQRSSLREAREASSVRSYSPLTLAAIMLTLIFVLVLGTAVIASVLIHLLGWGLGLLAFAAVGGVGIAGPKGLLHALWAKFDPSNAIARATGSKPSGELVRA